MFNAYVYINFLSAPHVNGTLYYISVVIILVVLLADINPVLFIPNLTVNL